jgi:hypothetical protein
MDRSSQQFAGPEETLDISNQNIMHIMGWLFNQHNNASALPAL